MYNLNTYGVKRESQKIQDRQVGKSESQPCKTFTSLIENYSIKA